MRRPNYYLLLELDSSEQSIETIAAAIKKKHAQWSRDCCHPTKGQEARQKLGWLSEQEDGTPGIRTVMEDAALREVEARECNRICEGQKQEARKELQRYVSVLASRGYLFGSEITALIGRFARRLTEEEVRQGLYVSVRQDPSRDASRNATTKPMLDASMTRAIERCLRIVGKDSLYDFLELSTTSNREALLKRCRELEREARTKLNKSARVTAQSELAGFCLRLFKDDDERQRYDNTLAMQGLHDMDDLIACAGATGVIDSPTMESLLAVARSTGCPIEEAEHYICAWASKNNCVVHWSREM